MKTGMRAWVDQRKRDIARKGKAKVPWVVYWNDPNGQRKQKSCGPGKDGWRLTKKEKARLHAELVSGTYDDKTGGCWRDFRNEYESKVADGMGPETRRCTLVAMNHFQRIAGPTKMTAITSRTMDGYVSARRKEPGKKRGDLVSPATVNKELRHLKAVLGFAAEWGYLSKVPKMRMVKEPVKLPTYVTPDDFATIYRAADAARMPRGLPYAAADWWRALFVFNYMTGWRISEPLSLRRDDLDLDEGFTITRHDDNKGNRDDRVPLTEVVVDHLRKIASFEPVIFPWPHHERSLWSEYARIQRAAGIHLPCRENHEHTSSCHVYGFHDLRRAIRHAQRRDALSG